MTFRLATAKGEVVELCRGGHRTLPDCSPESKAAAVLYRTVADMVASKFEFKTIQVSVQWEAFKWRC